MIMRILHAAIGPASLACMCILGVAQAAMGGTDAFFVPPPPASSRDAPSYESDYTAAARLSGNAQNTPEADARPGEYYFLRGAEAFRKHDYTFAIQMYQVAASWAFKPAEYNLGVIYSRGQGVAIDLPRAMAWMALAAERDDQHYVDAREAVYAELSQEQFAQANEIWRALKKTYGDEVALRRAKARWAQVKAGMTGSRVGSVGNMTVGVPNANGGDPSFPKPVSEGMKGLLQSQGITMAQSTATSPAEATGGEGTDATIAYRQLRESDNPYDPKFKRSGAIGIATVGEPTSVKGKAPKDAAAEEPDAGQPQQ